MVTKIEIQEVEKFIDDMEYYFGESAPTEKLNRMRDILFRLREEKN